MGLDITAYRKLVPMEGTISEDGDEFVTTDGTTREYDEFYSPYVNPHFEGRAEGIDEDTIYSFSEAFGFRAGSYSGYGQFREFLAEMAGYQSVYSDHYHTNLYQAGAWAASEGPFWELINFSDCEGAIGPVVAAKLLKDFEAYQSTVDERPDDYVKQKYADWRKAFELAADGGAIHFH